MKNLYTFCTLAAFLASGFLVAQNRYFDEVFTDVDVSKNVMYGWNYTVYINPPNPDSVPLMMDVYEPKNDTVTDRPLIILAHAGSFLPKCVSNTLPLGDKEDSAMVEMCTQFAKRGFVAVSMDYRMGWNPISLDPTVRKGTIMTAVYLAMQDMKACVRYMKSESTTYNIDKNKIVVAGSNSGGYVALTYGALTDTSELWLGKFRDPSPPNLPLVNIHLWGDFEGDNGTPGLYHYNTPTENSDVQMVLNLGGAMADTSWQEAGELPIISFHGEADSLTPINTDFVIVAATGQVVVKVSGSRHLSRTADRLGNQEFHDFHINDVYSDAQKSRTTYSGFFPFFGPDRGYEPWAWYDDGSPCIGPGPPGGSGTGSAANPFANKTRALAYIDTIMGYFCPRAVQVLGLPGNTVGIGEYSKINSSVDVYPNPSDDIIYIQSENEFKSVMIYDVHGKLIYSDLNENNFKMQMDVSTLQKGMYIINVETNEGIARKKIMVN